MAGMLITEGAKKNFKLVIYENYWKLFNAYRELYADTKVNICNNYPFIISPGVVDDIVKRASRDFERIMLHHEIINGVNSTKHAGYFTYWICRLRPIAVATDNPILVDISLEINELLAVYVSMTFLLIEAADKKYTDEMRSKHPEFLNRNVADMSKLRPIMNDLIYTLRYRTLNPDLLSIIYFYISINGTNDKFFNWYEEYGHNM